MRIQELTYTCNETKFLGYAAIPEKAGKSPLVLICHDWSGRNDFAIEKANAMAKLGYVGFAVDLYGDARVGADNDEKSALMNPMIEDRNLLRSRLLAALKTAMTIPAVDQTHIGVIGFCFGGLCALDLARASSNVTAAVSCHGFLNAPSLDNSALKAKILVLHGYKDPMVQEDALPPFYAEMTKANVDWQVHIYGTAKHAFTNPLANDVKLGTVFDSVINMRAMASVESFFAEAFQ